MKRHIYPAVLLSALKLAASAQDAALPEKIGFNRDVRPILSENCFKCHGFDPKTRKADRRLDTREGALAELEGVRAVVPGKSAESEVHLRIRSKDPEEIMPPPKSGKKLTDRDRAILDRWIEQGAVYEPHWAYAPLAKPPAPQPAKEKNFIRNPIDAFVLARQQSLGLAHAPEADPATLVRRLSLDLTGLPPKPALVDEFSRGALTYEQVVERLLASPAYGERMAVYWLDLVRYADSIGYHSDNPRNVSPYRDYVIRAFNENKPFDKFTVEQVAGDLLPQPTLWQRVASGYNRLTLTTEEGGAQPRDYEQRSLTDRVRSIGTTWLGQTTGCAQCHDHKFDPFTMRDFYRLGAFFADIKEEPIGRREDGMIVGEPGQEAELQRLNERVNSLRTEMEAPRADLDAAQAEWEGAQLNKNGAQVAWTPLHPSAQQSKLATAITVEPEEIIRAEPGPGGADAFTITIKTNAAPLTGLRLEALRSARLANGGPGNAGNGNFVLSELSVTGPDGAPVALEKAAATYEQNGYPASEAIDGVVGDRNNGWAVLGGEGRDQTLFVQLKQPLNAPGEKTLTVTLRFDYGDRHTLGKFRLSATSQAGPYAPAASSLPPQITKILQTDPEKRSADQKRELTTHFRSTAPQLAAVRTQLAEATAARDRFQNSLVRSLVTESMPRSRTVRVLPRGDWMNDTGEIVEPGVPAFLPQPAAADGDGKRRLNRLDLAQWLVAPENPLTARVFVNRLWKLFYGTGLSKVLDDVGSQGEAPVHVALLDWLAADFVASGWDVKHTVGLMVGSSTYRQSSKAPAALVQRDPLNRELARQSRFRLDAEFVRDNALSISGLLVERVGGRSVNPYQPAGYWENLNFPTREWEMSRDDNQWRRGLYTWWQRSYLQPSLAAFDAPSREECVAERLRSNIPQQALALLNDPTYVEAARALAARILREGGADAQARLTWAFRTALARPPRPDETATLKTLLEKHTALFSASPADAEALLKTGLAPVPAGVNKTELAAWTSVARAILNLHETITRS